MHNYFIELWLLVFVYVLLRFQKRYEKYSNEQLQLLHDISASLRIMADGKPVVRGSRPSQSVSSKSLPQLEVAELPPEAIAPSLKRPPKPPSGSELLRNYSYHIGFRTPLR